MTVQRCVGFVGDWGGVAVGMTPIANVFGYCCDGMHGWLCCVLGGIFNVLLMGLVEGDVCRVMRRTCYLSGW